MEKTLVKLHQKRTLIKEDAKKLVGDYELTLNSSRLVYCGCGVTMIGNSPQYMNCHCPLHYKHGDFLFDPACSESCREKYQYHCKYCKSLLARVYGAGHNGELMCSSICLGAKMKSNVPMEEDECFEALKITAPADKKWAEEDAEILQMLFLRSLKPDAPDEEEKDVAKAIIELRDHLDGKEEKDEMQQKWDEAWEKAQDTEFVDMQMAQKKKKRRPRKRIKETQSE